MNIGKEEYEVIPIPAELDAMVAAAVRRAQRAGRRRRLRRFAAAAAAVLCAIFACVCLAAFGRRGAQAPGESVTLSFAGAMPHYSVARYSAPNRLELTFGGAEEPDLDALFSSLRGTGAVRDAYRTLRADDSCFGLVIVLSEGWRCELAKLTGTGALALNFTRSSRDGLREVFYLRSASMPVSDRLGLLCEEYRAEGATQLRTLSGNYIVTIGQYAARAEAEAALAALTQAHGEGGFFVASGAADETPEN